MSNRRQRNIEHSLQKANVMACKENKILAEANGKLVRIENSLDYNEAITYEGTTGFNNVIQIVYTGTTSMGFETLTKTISYVDQTINGSNVTNIQYS